MTTFNEKISTIGRGSSISRVWTLRSPNSQPSELGNLTRFLLAGMMVLMTMMAACIKYKLVFCLLKFFDEHIDDDCDGDDDEGMTMYTKATCKC